MAGHRRRGAPSRLGDPAPRPPRRGWPPRSPRPTSRARRSRPRPRPATSSARAAHLGPDRVEQQVAGRRDPAADHDPVGREDGDHVADPDAEVAADLGRARRAPGASPARAASTAASAVAVPHAAAIRSARANASRQPWLPQPHGGPSGSIVWWPTSPAVPSCPRTTRPSIAITPPTPVPRVSPTIDDAPRPAPSRSSASPNARASLISADGDAEGRRHRGRDRTARPVAGHVDQEPGRARRRVVQPGDADAQRWRCRGQRSIALRPVVGDPPDDRVRARRRSRSGPGPDRGPATRRPSRSTTAHLRFVTPRSIPRWCDSSVSAALTTRRSPGCTPRRRPR